MLSCYFAQGGLIDTWQAEEIAKYYRDKMIQLKYLKKHYSSTEYPPLTRQYKPLTFLCCHEEISGTPSFLFILSDNWVMNERKKAGMASSHWERQRFLMEKRTRFRKQEGREERG